MAAYFLNHAPRGSAGRRAQVSTYEYDSLGRPISELAAPGAVTYTTYSFDALGRLTSDTAGSPVPAQVVTYTSSDAGGVVPTGPPPSPAAGDVSTNGG
jgi:YD repeat-containing protein